MGFRGMLIYLEDQRWPLVRLGLREPLNLQVAFQVLGYRLFFQVSGFEGRAEGLGFKCLRDCLENLVSLKDFFGI